MPDQGQGRDVLVRLAAMDARTITVGDLARLRKDARAAIAAREEPQSDKAERLRALSDHLHEALAFMRSCELSGEKGADHSTVISALEAYDGFELAAREDTERPDGMLTIDARCLDKRCASLDMYRMVGRCHNCDTKDILILYTKTHAATPQACSTCGTWRGVHAKGLAGLDEIPAVEQEPKR
jgi:hypothetical protein